MARRGRPPKKKEVTIKSKETRIFFGLLLSVIGIGLLLSKNFTGAIPLFFYKTFGQTIYLLGLIMLFLGLKLMGLKIFFTTNRFLYGLILFLFITLPFLSYWLPFEHQDILAFQGRGGGTLGLSIHQFLLNLLGNIELGFLIIMYIVAVSMLSNITLSQFASFVNNLITIIFNIFVAIFGFFKKKLVKPEIITNQVNSLAESTQNLEIKLPSLHKSDDNIIQENKLEEKLKTSVKDVDVSELELDSIGDDITSTDKEILSNNDDNLHQKQSNMKVTFGPDLLGNKAEDIDKNKYSEIEQRFVQLYKTHFDDWKKPPVSLFIPPTPDNYDEKEIRKKTQIIENTLQSFRIQARVSKIFIGPSIVQYALNLAVGTKVSKVKNLARDLSLALAAPSDAIRIETISGTNLIGIEVPREKPHMVRIREVLESKEFSRDVRLLPMAIGKDIQGNIITIDLHGMPHLLIAGATGTGKSVTLNDIIVGFLMNFSPDELKLILVDPKMVEMALYNNLPHLLTPVITDMDKVVGALEWLIFEMQSRYKLFKEKRVRNIEEFNKQSDYRLPYIVLIIDEMADLILTKKGDVEQKIVRLAQLSRATGIHLILATQRPSVNVITGLIKANIPARIALGVTSGVDSRVIIDQIGAESLIGKGDMLIKTPDTTKLRRVQGAYVSTEEIQKLSDYIKNYVKDTYGVLEPLYIDEVTQSTNTNTLSGNTAGISDPLLKQAIELVIKQQKASASSLQRYLKIGFNRAARLIDEMEELGIVSPPKGSKPRDVLVSSLDEIA